MDDAMTPAPQEKGSTPAVISRKRTARPQHPDRLTVSPEALERINGWLTDLTGRLKGISLTRNQLVNWLIMAHEAELSAQELKRIEEEFFDELKFAEWAVKELRNAQARGERVRLADIVARHSATKTEKPARQSQAKRSRNEVPSAAAGAEKQSHLVASESVESRIFLEKNGVK